LTPPDTFFSTLEDMSSSGLSTLLGERTILGMGGFNLVLSMDVFSG
jgi:hypothetical protein